MFRSAARRQEKQRRDDALCIEAHRRTFTQMNAQCLCSMLLQLPIGYGYEQMSSHYLHLQATARMTAAC